MQLILSLIVGAISGWIAGAIMKVNNTGWIRNIIIGIIGSAVGGIVVSLIGFSAHGLFADIIVSVIGACLFLYAGRKLFQ